ncbi:MAG TPA: biopolymer transporter ExbD [Phycisphaerae bacterium]
MLLKSQEADSGGVMDMTPMIDTVFNLLIFFLVAGSLQQAEREMKIALPLASSAGPISAALREIVVNVDAEGRIIVTGRQISADDLRTMVKEAVVINAQQKVIVRGDRGTAYANVVRVLDICKAAGVQEPFLDTVLKE